MMFGFRVVAASAVVCAALTTPAHYSMAAEIPGTPRVALKLLDDQIAVERAEVDQLRVQAETLRIERGELNKRLIDTAARIQESEGQISRAEDRLHDLDNRQLQLRKSLKTRRNLLIELLAGLQRLGRNPPPAMAVHPEDALEAVRSAILLGSVLPELRNRAQKLAVDLDELVDLRQRIATERERLHAQTVTLAKEHDRIELLLRSKRATLVQTEEDLVEARRQSEELATKTQTLRQLIAEMDKQYPKPLAMEAPAEPVAEMSPGTAQLEQQQMAFLNPGRIRPAMPFSQAKGVLPLPVHGATITMFGQDDGLGAAAKGISLATRNNARVTSPCDGWVKYSGPFRSYGHVLIIDGGHGYHVVLAGLANVDVALGQFVLAGEPVGMMGAQARRADAIIGTTNERPVLYIEFRKDGQAIDPSPWWAKREEKVSG